MRPQETYDRTLCDNVSYRKPLSQPNTITWTFSFTLLITLSPPHSIGHIETRLYYLDGVGVST